LQKAKINALRVRYCHDILMKENNKRHALLKKAEDFHEAEVGNVAVAGPST